VLIIKAVGLVRGILPKRCIID